MYLGCRDHPAPTLNDPHAHLSQTIADIGRLSLGQGEHSAVDFGEFSFSVDDLIALVIGEMHAQVVGGLELAEVVGRRDQRLAGDTVGEDSRAPDSGALDEGDSATEVGSDQGRRIAPRAARPPTAWAAATIGR